MEEEKQKVGVVFNYFAKPEVAAINITDGVLEIGDTIHIKGETTDFTQKIESMQIEREPVKKAEKGQSVGIKVKERVRPNDVVYKVMD